MANADNKFHYLCDDEGGILEEEALFFLVFSLWNVNISFVKKEEQEEKFIKSLETNNIYSVETKTLLFARWWCIYVRLSICNVNNSE